ncbi:MAG: 12-oxophytodienoate reductase, partial [Sphingomonadaceae bacterium]
MAVSSLLQPFRCKSLTLANRIVMAPMTRYFSPGGVPTSEVADYYRRRAKGDVGLLITEGVATDRPASRNNENVPTLYGDAALAGWRHVVGEVHGAGGRIAPQLWHTGPVPDSIGIYPLSPEVESPSAYYSEDVRPGRAMSDKDIEEVAASFARAAMTAKRLGFDCIEFHGAHSYIFDLFFWPKTNFRTDRYGGPDFANRTRFAVEVIEAVRAAVGEDFVLIFRFTQWKQQDYGARVAETP